MTDRGADVGKTFTDYQEESDIGFVEIRLGPGHLWCGMSVSQLSLPAELLVAMVGPGRDGHRTPGQHRPSGGGTGWCWPPAPLRIRST